MQPAWPLEGCVTHGVCACPYVGQATARDREEPLFWRLADAGPQCPAFFPACHFELRSSESRLESATQAPEEGAVSFDLCLPSPLCEGAAAVGYCAPYLVTSEVMPPLTACHCRHSS